MSTHGEVAMVAFPLPSPFACVAYCQHLPSISHFPINKLTQSVSSILQKDQTLMAYQIAFDLYEGATQQFLSSVTSALQATVPFVSSNGPTASSDASTEGKTDKNGSTEKSG